MQKISRILATAVILLPSITQASPENGWLVDNNVDRPGGNTPTDLVGLIKQVTGYLISLIAIVSVLVIVWGGFQYLTSIGDQDGIRKAKDTINYGIFGLATAAIAYALVAFIVQIMSQAA